MAKVVASGGIAVPVVLALVLGPVPFAIALAAIAVFVLVDLSALLSRAAARPILPAALVPAVGLPVAVAVWPEAGWDLVPPFVAVGFLVTFLFALLFGRRRGIVQGAGTTMLAGLVVGVGAASMVLLRGLPQGFRWSLAFVLIVCAADLGALPAARFAGGQGAHDEAEEGHLVGSMILTVLVAGALLVLLRPPLEPAVLALLALAALTAAVGGADLWRNLVAEARVESPDVPSRPGTGVLLAAFDGLLLGAPLAYVLARSAAL